MFLANVRTASIDAGVYRRAARDAKDSTQYQQALITAQQQAMAVPLKQFVKIGSPGYDVTKVKDPFTGQLGLYFRIQYPRIKPDVVPVYRLMSSFEQKVEQADRNYQYLIVSAD